VPLNKRQCFLLISAGSLSHFFLDHLFEENGHSTMYTWILSTGWWRGHAPINPDAVVVVGLLCTCLMGGVCVHQQSEAWKVRSRKIEPIFFSHPGDSHPVLYVVCQSDIPAATPSTCHRWRSWSWSDNLSCHLSLSPAWLVRPFNEPKGLYWCTEWTATSIICAVHFYSHICRRSIW